MNHSDFEQSHQARKSLGQHFLRDRSAIERMISIMPADARVLEIGPGLGALTESLLPRHRHLALIEKDDRFAALWQNKQKDYPGLEVHHGDVLRLLDPVIEHFRPEWVIGNLPYNISGPLTASLASHAVPGGMVLMYQREVAERIVAGPGSKAYGSLSVLVRHYYQPRRLFTLPPAAFTPPPKVHSAVILLKPHRHKPECDFSLLQETVRTGFAHRRKTLANNFRNLVTADMLREIRIDPGQRPEQIDYAGWVALARLISQKGSGC